PVIQDNFVAGIPSVVKDIVDHAYHMAGQGENVCPIGMQVRELRYCYVVWGKFSVVAVSAEIRTPCCVGRRHISSQRPFDAEAEIGLMPILVKGLAECPNRAVSNVLPKWARVVMCVFHGANPCHGGIQGLR